jgi:hypothetical protein
MDIGPLQELTADVFGQDAALFAIEPRIQWTLRRSALGDVEGDRVFNAPNEPAGAAIVYYLKSAAAEKARISVSTPGGEPVAKLDGPAAAGLNRVVWDMRRTAVSGPPAGPQSAASPPRFSGGRLVPPGEYVVTLEAGGRTLTRRARLLPPPGLDDPPR